MSSFWSFEAILFQKAEMLSSPSATEKYSPVDLFGEIGLCGYVGASKKGRMKKNV